VAISHLPGSYTVSVSVVDPSGHRASDRRAFLVRHAWWDDIPWTRGYTTVSAPSDIPYDFDKALVLIEFLANGFSGWYHDWVGATFMDPVTGKTLVLFNRYPRSAFDAHMGKILYALVISGDSDWWDGWDTYKHHWNLAAGSSDREILRRLVLLS